MHAMWSRGSNFWKRDGGCGGATDAGALPAAGP